MHWHEVPVRPLPNRALRALPSARKARKGGANVLAYRSKTLNQSLEVPVLRSYRRIAQHWHEVPVLR